jgi:DNA-binding protein YbaB
MKMNMNKLMQQVQETQKKIQDELTRMRVTGSAGGGMVEVSQG